jgi:hypothetical protein
MSALVQQVIDEPTPVIAGPVWQVGLATNAQLELDNAFPLI